MTIVTMVREVGAGCAAPGRGASRAQSAPCAVARRAALSAAMALAAILALPAAAPGAAAGGVQLQAPAPPQAPQAPPAPAPKLAPIQVPAERRQLIGLRFATVEERELSDRLETTGTIEPDEQLQSYVQTRFAGWIKTVFANQTYQYVRKGDRLFTIYSPDLASAEQEYLLALREQRQVTDSSVPGVSDGASSIAGSALDRLRLFGVSPREIARLKREGTPRDTVEIDSPSSGYITERAALPNMYAQPDMRLYSIADLSRVWVYAAVFQDEIGRVKVGDPAQVRVDAFPGKTFSGRVDFIWPQIDPATRTARVRCGFDNRSGLLKPGMFVKAVLEPRLGRGLAIPDSGVLRTGAHDIVFIDRGGGYLEPVEVELGAHLDHDFVVLKGLSAGDRIVASANFLIDSESQLQAALGAFVPPPLGVSAAASQAQAAIASAALEMSSEPSPPARGRNKLRVTLKNSSGKPIEGAQVSVTFSMAAMPSMGMAAMRAQATATDQGNGAYATEVDLQSGGTWQVTIVATKNGKTIAGKQFSISVSGHMEM
jgi:membrane fusion protein, copper/silver efflux system